VTGGQTISSQLFGQTDVFVDEGIRSYKVVTEDGLSSSQTVKSKLLFVSRIKPTVIILSDWKSNSVLSRYNSSHQWLGQKPAVLKVSSLLIVQFTSVRRTPNFCYKTVDFFCCCCFLCITFFFLCIVFFVVFSLQQITELVVAHYTL